ncbi:MAG: UvrD-helicase domain-containing protein [Holophagaceae bacterium]
MKLPELKLNEAMEGGILQEPFLVLSASAGSGKTFSLVTFILGFLGQGSARPHELMAMSYTNDSASDLKDRIIRPLEKIATLSEASWTSLLPLLVSGDWKAWDQACKILELDTEFVYAARQWTSREGSKPAWSQSARDARHYWVSIRREAQLLSVTTIHGAALGIIGLPEKGIIEITHPKLTRLLKSVCRTTWKSLPEGLGEEMLSAVNHDWSRLAQIYDSFMDGQGQWRDRWPSLASLEMTGQKLINDFNQLVVEPKRLAKLTSAGVPHANFQKILSRLRPVAVAPQGRAALKQIARWNDLFFNKEEVVKSYFAQDHPELDDFIQNLRAYMDLLEQHVAQGLEKALMAFGKRKAHYHWMTYGDIVRQTCEYLSKNPLPVPPKLLLIDEYQDANPVQDTFLTYLCPERLIVVGDTKQAIYSFRGGDSTLLRNKIQQAPPGQAYSLLTNYRSRAPIVGLANFIVRNLFPRILPNYRNFDDDQRAAHPDHLQGTTLGMTLVKPEKNQGYDLTPAFDWITALAREEGWQEAGFGPTADKVKPTRALLIARRTNVHKLMRHLRERGIEAMLRTNEGRLESPGVRLMNALLGFFAEPGEPRHLFTLLRSPWIGMTDHDLLQAARLCQEQGHTQGLQRLHYLIEQPSTYSEGLLWLASLEGHTTAHLLSEGLMRHPGVLELINALQVFGRLEAERARRNLEEWMTATRELSDAPAVAYFQIQETYLASDKGDALLDEASVDLIVSTIHQSKGLEFDSVILPLFGTPPNRIPKGSLYSLNDDRVFKTGWSLGTLNGSQLRSVKSQTRTKELEDSTNLFYVAITRAKSRVMLIQKARVKSNKEWDGVPEHRWELPWRLHEQRGSRKARSNDWAVLGTEIREGVSDVTIFDDHAPLNVPLVPAGFVPPAEPSPDHPSTVDYGEKVFHESTPEEDRARRQGLALHELVRELLLVSPEARSAWLLPYRSIPFYDDILPQAERCLQKLHDQGWLQFPRRTEYPLEGTAVSLETGFADLVMWDADRIHPQRVIVVDYKRSIPDSKREDYREQVRRYMHGLHMLHPQAQIEGYLYHALTDALERVVHTD